MKDMNRSRPTRTGTVVRGLEQLDYQPNCVENQGQGLQNQALVLLLVGDMITSSKEPESDPQEQKPL